MTDDTLPHQLLSTRIRDNILSDLATLPVDSGQRYYTEAQIASRYQVSRNTVRRAMGELERRGYLQRQRGRGSIILKIPGQAAPMSQSVPSDARPQRIAPSSSRMSARPRLVTILPQWDDSTEGFYAAHVIHALTGIEELRGYAIEIRHPTDPLNFSNLNGLTCFAIDPRGNAPHRLAALAAQGVRIVIATPSYAMPFALNIQDDARQAVSRGVRMMAEAGHRDIGIILSDLDHNDYRMALHGYLDAHDELNLPIHPRGIVRCCASPVGQYPQELPVDEVRAWISTFVGGVRMLAEACKTRRMEIPRDLSVLCLDDPTDHYVGMAGREISVIRADATAMTRTLASQLLAWDDTCRGQVVSVPMQYVDRKSILPPAK